MRVGVFGFLCVHYVAVTLAVASGFWERFQAWSGLSRRVMLEQVQCLTILQVEMPVNQTNAPEILSEIFKITLSKGQSLLELLPKLHLAKSDFIFN